jgi:hypothetical protein
VVVMTRPAKGGKQEIVRNFKSLCHRGHDRDNTGSRRMSYSSPSTAGHTQKALTSKRSASKSILAGAS